MRHLGFAVVWAFAFACHAAEKRALTVAASIETTRAMIGMPISRTLGPSDDDADRYHYPSPVIVSPDGRRYVVMLIRGDLARNGVWMELISGHLGSFAAATQVETVARLFTNALGARHGFGEGSRRLVFPGENPPVWFDDSERVAFHWEDNRGVPQVVAVNVRTHRIEYLTNHPTDVVEFAVGPHGGLLYSARVSYSRAPSERLLRDGFFVRNPDALSLLDGFVDGTSRWDIRNNIERYVLTASHAQARRIETSGDGISSRAFPAVAPLFSPDGRRIAVYGSASPIPIDWEFYDDRALPVQVRDARAGSPVAKKRVYQHYIIDIDEARAHPLWDAPSALLTKSVQVAWSPDGQSLLVGPTFVPLAQADPSGRAGNVIAEVAVATRKFALLPISPDVVAKGIARLHWLSEDTVEVVTANASTLRFEKMNGHWSEVPRTVHGSEPIEAPVQVEMRQDLNTPPALFALDVSAKREQMILDLNPQLRTDFRLGHVEHVHWSDRAGRRWSGLLYYPVNYSPRRRYPLVIQTRGTVGPAQFSLNGAGGNTPGLGPGVAAYAAQPLANRDVAVLQMSDKAGVARNFGSEEARAYMVGYESAAEHLVAVGLANRSRIGLMGFSRSGWWVQYALTHSDFPFAAAITVDNVDGGYVQAALTSWSAGFTEQMNDVLPFGDGLKVWLEHAPAFNADRVRAPLLLQNTSASLPLAFAEGWEMFSRLRRLNKPAELYVAPNIEYGHHLIQNPEQCLAVQQRAVDWWEFWLKDYEDPDPEKQEQYEHWRRLRIQNRNVGDPRATTEGPKRQQ